MATSSNDKRATVSLYQACTKCSAKWFVAAAVTQCPRCGCDCLLSDRVMTPWLQRCDEQTDEDSSQ